MCRLMGYVSPAETTLSEISGPNFEQFAALSSVHNDGWGIAAINGDHPTTVVLEPTPAIDSPKFLDSAKSLKSDGALLHFRWATAGLEVVEENTHPFSYKDLSFIHNGGIMPKETLDPFIDVDLFGELRGGTDSERYFYLLLSRVRTAGLVAGVLDGVRQIRENCTFSSLNAMLLTPKYYLVISEHNNAKIPGDFPPDYYELAYRADDRGVLVASSGWDQHEWKELPNHRLLVINRETLDLEIVEI
ncbi:MAG: class II glutamine amidotransferase [Actinomycetes bacterium]